MKEFTGWEYLLIDVANGYGKDKLRFEDRIQWTEDNLTQLEQLAEDRGTWKDKPMYLKAVMALRKAQQGIPTGHLVGFDAICSGMQIMSALTGCHAGANATGLVDPDRRADAYTDCTDIMSTDLGRTLPNMRLHVKNACMTHLYGSKAEPKKEFGADTPELQAFFKAMMTMAPGACELLDDLLNSWQPYALLHEWLLPDGYHSRVKVLQRKEHRIEVEELNKSSFTYVYYENEGEEKGVKNAANVIHSIDAYVLRSLIRRCNYDKDIIERALDAVTDQLFNRPFGEKQTDYWLTEEVTYYRDQYERSGMADAVIAEHINIATAQTLSTPHLRALKTVFENMLEHKPFEIVTVHDDFKCHPNNMNWLRKHYRNILAELADSEILSDIFTQLHGKPCTYQKKSTNLSTVIRNSNYALC